MHVPSLCEGDSVVLFIKGLVVGVKAPSGTWRGARSLIVMSGEQYRRDGNAIIKIADSMRVFVFTCQCCMYLFIFSSLGYYTMINDFALFPEIK